MHHAKPIFVAYVYPGWHSTPYRPGVDEWQLLDHFVPYFPGHSPPSRPLAGRYDDSLPEVAKHHVDIAKQFGIHAFTYFLYYEPDRFVMATPMQRSLEVAAESGEFSVAATWCIRMPVNRFPLRLNDRKNGHARPSHGSGANSVLDVSSLGDMPLEDLTLEQLEHVLGSDLLESIPVSTFLAPLPWG